MAKKKIKVPKTRNWLAVRARLRTGAGSHGDKKKQKSKEACRGRIKC